MEHINIQIIMSDISLQLLYNIIQDENNIFQFLYNIYNNKKYMGCSALTPQFKISGEFTQFIIMSSFNTAFCRPDSVDDEVQYRKELKEKVEELQSLLKERKYDKFVSFYCIDANVATNEVIQKITQAFDNKYKNTIIIYVGVADDSGAWIFQSKHRVIKPQQILKKWQNRAHPIQNQNLLIISDSPHSQVWYDKVKNYPLASISIITSSYKQTLNDKRLRENINLTKNIVANLKNNDLIYKEPKVEMECYSAVIKFDRMNLYFDNFQVLARKPTETLQFIEVNRVNMRYFKTTLNYRNEHQIGNIQVNQIESGSYYLGKIKDGKFHGKGLFSIINGFKYDGEWENGVIQGKGIIYFANGEKYDGQWFQGRKHGTGIYYYSNNELYSGNWKNDQKIGKGLYKYMQGDYYEGEWEQKRQGQGLYFQFNSGFKYEGIWVKGKLMSPAKIYFPNGNIYEGQWIRKQIDKKQEENRLNSVQSMRISTSQSTCHLGLINSMILQGDGLMKYKNGDIYDGHWKNGKKNGSGTLISKQQRYQGNWKDDIKQGKGIHIYSDQTRYQGQWIANKQQGQGILYFENGDSVSGNWTDGYISQYGICKFKNGDIYQGQWIGRFQKQSIKNLKKYESLMKHGKGTCKCGNGDTQIGYFLNDKLEGLGKKIFNNKDQYIGNLLQGLREGKGLQKYVNGDKYDGYWHLDQRSGHGEIVYYNGDVYQGDWINDFKFGKGIYISLELGQYTGQWKNDKKDGKGVYEFKDGSKYTGQWKQDLYDGQGTFIAENGQYYIGNWNKGKQNGEGIYLFKDGSKYDGQWKKGAISGFGTWYFANKNTYKGYWKNNMMHGTGIFYYANGDRYEGQWRDNKKYGIGTKYSADGKIQKKANLISDDLINNTK